MVRVLYMIGTRASFNFGQFIFDPTVQHAQSHAMLKPIAYPSLLCSIIESKHSDIVTVADEVGPSPGLLTISPKLLQGIHVKPPKNDLCMAMFLGQIGGDSPDEESYGGVLCVYFGCPGDVS
ncbi:hypothetical protein LIER_19645 [Lithospermum erythrorhizon]|uniref:Uncharacterized protein n=1 Tax=Lithospermum erythrorhizon TaxID=34254 RepID=A0AAV3QKT5_LITER